VPGWRAVYRNAVGNKKLIKNMVGLDGKRFKVTGLARTQGMDNLLLVALLRLTIP